MILMMMMTMIIIIIIIFIPGFLKTGLEKISTHSKAD